MDVSRRFRAGDVAKGTVLPAGGYQVLRYNGVGWLAHRLAFLYMTGEWPKGQVVHKNGNPLDNRWANLEDTTVTEVQRSKEKYVNVRYGVRGVSRVVYKNGTIKWRVRIATNSKVRYLGTFDDYFEAVCCRKKAELQWDIADNA